MSRMADNPKGKGFGVHLDKGKVYVSITSNWDDDAIRLQTEQALEPKKWHQVTVTHSGSRMAEGLRVHVDGQQPKVNVLLDTLYRPFRNAVGVFKQPFRIATGWGPERALPRPHRRLPRLRTRIKAGRNLGSGYGRNAE